MLTIWKFEFEVADEATVEMPVGAEILSVGMQVQHTICIWAKVDDKEKSQKRVFYARGTGHSIGWMPVGAEFIGTVIDGEFVWHIFGEK